MPVIPDYLRRQRKEKSGIAARSVDTGQSRLNLWDLVDSRYAGAVLLELSDPVRSSLIETMPAEELVDVAGRGKLMLPGE